MAHIANLGHSIQAGKKQPACSQKLMSLSYIEIYKRAEMLEN